MSRNMSRIARNDILQDASPRQDIFDRSIEKSIFRESRRIDRPMTIHAIRTGGIAREISGLFRILSFTFSSFCTFCSPVSSEERCVKLGYVVFALLFLAPTHSDAADIALDFSSVTGGYSDAVPRVIGWEFTTGSQPISVDQLGVFDFGANGLLTAHSVAIYEALSQNMIMTANVPSGSSATLSGLFRFVSVSPTTLQANTGYVIAASWVENADAFVWSPGITSPSADINGLQIASAITLGLTSTGHPASARYVDTSSTLQFPTKRIGDVFPGDPRSIFVGPNFTFTSVVPEPSNLISLATATVGLIVFGGLRRRSAILAFPKGRE